MSLENTATAPRSGEADGQGPERILLATDGAAAALAATRWVAARASRRPAVVTLTHIARHQHRDGVLDPVPTRAEHVVWQEREYLNAIAPGVPLRTRVLDGPDESVLRSAATDADLVVLGSNRIGGRPRVPVPSFSTRIGAAPVVPTVLVPRGWAPGEGPVVVGVDETVDDRRVTDFAAREALALGAALVVEHVWHLPWERHPALLVTSDDEAWRTTVKRHLDAAVATIRERHPGLEIRGELRHGHPAEGLAAAAGDAALLVIGAHLVTPGGQYLLGSVGRGVIDTPPCPVAVVPAGVR